MATAVWLRNELVDEDDAAGERGKRTRRVTPIAKESLHAVAGDLGEGSRRKGGR